MSKQSSMGCTIELYPYDAQLKKNTYEQMSDSTILEDHAYTIAESKQKEIQAKENEIKFKKQQEEIKKKLEEDKKKYEEEKRKALEEEEKKKYIPQEMNVSNIPGNSFIPAPKIEVSKPEFKQIQKESTITGKKLYYTQIIKKE